MSENKELTQSPRENAEHRGVHSFIMANIMHRRAIDRWAISLGMDPDSSAAGIHRGQHRMLMYLSKCKTTPSQKDLAKCFEISPAAVAVSLKKLESEGYIKREKCSERSDSRYNEIKITELGRKVVSESCKYFRHVDSQAFKGFSDEELEIFAGLLERVQENLKTIEPLPSAAEDECE
ncbi:MAG: winged helix-turn-helix transcriptional regulator [Clostridia bacterium]|nr:winged helix-turn-helix transcriptional regulator [Clostridia bacterium]